jgi:hypothetical protein
MKKSNFKIIPGAELSLGVVSLLFMKSILLLFTLTLGIPAHSQEAWEISLSKNLKSHPMATWEQGDYKIYVELNQMEKFLGMTAQEYINNISRCGEQNSNLVKYYRPTAKRYQDAANLVGQANTDFDLKTLIVYNGIEDEKQNIGNSMVVRNHIKQLVDGGTAIVFYKDKQIFTLQSKSEYQNEGGILQSGYLIRTYFDDRENCIFTEYIHTGW